jgi:hypothetical protein
VPIYLVLCVLLFGAQKEFYVPLRLPFKRSIKSLRLRNIYNFGLSLFLIIIIGSFSLWAGYGFEFGSLYRLNGVKKNETSKAVATTEHFYEKMPLPMPSYFRTMQMQGFVSRLGHPAFLAGQHSTQGWWYYYFFAFLIKTPVPTLLLLIIAVVMLKKYSFRPIGKDEFFLIIPPAVVFIAGSFFTHTNVGLRHVLPVYPFIFVFIGKVVNLKTMKPRITKAALVLLCLWYVFSSLSIYPHYLAYFNEFVGGPNNGYKYLVDSNLDWGQDLPGLQEYIVKNKINKISLHYFGTADPKYYGFGDAIPVPYGFISGRINKSTAGVIAISATALQGVFDSYSHRYDWLKNNYKPITKIGYSIFVYNIPESK